jgi:hypothetical protein
MATRIYLRNGLGKPDVSDFGGSQGELLIDLQDKVIWTLDNSGTSVVMLGTDISNETIDWSQLDNVPTEFPPSQHEHEYSEINNGKSGLESKTLEIDIDDIWSELQALESEISALQGNLTFGGTVAMSTGTITQVTDAGSDKGFSTGAIPSDPPAGSNNIYFICEDGGTFEGDTYSSGDWLVSEGQGNGYTGIHFDSSVSVTWDQVGGKPSVFPPDDHTQDISTINGLQDALDDLSVDGHTHEISDVTGLQTALDGKASVVSISGGTY